MNTVDLVGRLTKDPVYYDGQVAVSHFTLAVDRPMTKKEEKKTDFIRISAFGRQAEVCRDFLSKGRLVSVTGSIQTGSYKGTDGKMIYTTDVAANRIEFLGGKKDVQESPKESGFDSDIPDAFQPGFDDDNPF